MKSGRGGPRKGAGRPPGQDNGVRITPTIRPEVKAWINQQPKSQWAVINRLVKAEIERQRAE